MSFIVGQPEWSEQISRMREIAAKYPVAWARFKARLGTEPEPFFTNYARSADPASLANATATQLVAGVLDAMPSGGAESSQHIAWRAEIVRLAKLVARVDGQPAVQTHDELVQRVETAKKRTDLPPGGLALLTALLLPAEPPNDSTFNDALAALALYFL